MAEPIKVELNHVHEISVGAKVEQLKDCDPEIITVVKFEVSGVDLSKFGQILQASRQNMPIRVTFTSDQLTLA